MSATIAFAIFVLLNVTEGILTYRIIEERGRMNSTAMRWAMSKLGPFPVIVGTRAAIVAVVLFLVVLLQDAALPVLGILCVIYALITALTLRRYLK